MPLRKEVILMRKWSLIDLAYRAVQDHVLSVLDAPEALSAEELEYLQRVALFFAEGDQVIAEQALTKVFRDLRGEL
jgi:hypothetical protein